MKSFLVLFASLCLVEGQISRTLSSSATVNVGLSNVSSARFVVSSSATINGVSPGAISSTSAVLPSTTENIGLSNAPNATIVGSLSATITVVSPGAASSTSVVLPSASQTANPPQLISPSSTFTALTSTSEPSVNSTVKPTTNSSKKMDGCKKYTVLNEADRAQGNTAKNYLRDRDLVPGWYRFQGAAGDRMADKCVSPGRCGTSAPGWLSGGHPTVVEGVVTRKVCYSDYNSCCGFSNNIKVKNCSSYYVYELQKTSACCTLRYCGNAGAVDECKNYTILSQADRAQGNEVRNYLCDRDLVTGWYRFQGAAGDRMPDKCVPMWRCGTVGPGWITGSHPTVEEGVVIRKVCYHHFYYGHYYHRCCFWRNYIKVKNCGAFFVYELQRTPCTRSTCKFRYCGNGGILCEPLQLAPNIRMNGPCTRLQGDACEFVCELGYDLIGSDIRQCSSNGSWTGTQPRCEAITCPTLSPPTNGELLGCNTTEMLYDTVCRFFL